MPWCDDHRTFSWVGLYRKKWSAIEDSFNLHNDCVELGVCEALRSKFLFELLLHPSNSCFPEASDVRRSCRRVVKLMLKSFRLHQLVDFFQFFSCTDEVAAIVTIDMTGCASAIGEPTKKVSVDMSTHTSK